MAERLVRGVDVNDETLALDVIRRVGAGGHFLGDKHTVEWFKKELFIPSELVDREDLKLWKEHGSKDTFKRAKEIAHRIIREHKPEPLPPDVERDLDNVTRKIMKSQGVDKLPLGP
jgi:trimethylamine--corrinoid protein Co-methyltransferase